MCYSSCTRNNEGYGGGEDDRREVTHVAFVNSLNMPECPAFAPVLVSASIGFHRLSVKAPLYYAQSNRYIFVAILINDFSYNNYTHRGDYTHKVKR